MSKIVDLPNQSLGHSARGFRLFQNHLFSEHRIERFTVAWIQQFTVGDSKMFLERFPPADIRWVAARNVLSLCNLANWKSAVPVPVFRLFGSWFASSLVGGILQESTPASRTWLNQNGRNVLFSFVHDRSRIEGIVARMARSPPDITRSSLLSRCSAGRGSGQPS